ncbi:hypothetical protein ACE193_25070 [Bernardetia sp. OM2101]|uniref:hypothetical protein n=1 Tax=Bernardetia sp. OM2101 TaxID=3344876 RepID=UPI0035D018F9
MQKNTSSFYSTQITESIINSFSPYQKRFFQDILTLHYGKTETKNSLPSHVVKGYKSKKTNFGREKWVYFSTYISPYSMRDVLLYAKLKGFDQIVLSIIAMIAYFQKNEEGQKDFFVEILQTTQDAIFFFEFYIESFEKPFPNSLKKAIKVCLENKNKEDFEDFFNQFPQKKTRLADCLNICRPRLKPEIDSAFLKENFATKIPIKSWKKELTKAHLKKGSYQEKRNRQSELWKTFIENDRLSHSEILEELPLIFKNSPKTVKLALQKLNIGLSENLTHENTENENAKTDTTISPFQILESYQQIHKAYVKRVHRILHTQEFVESIIAEQEEELHRLQVASKRIFKKWEGELFFGGYHRLMLIFHELDEQQRLFFTQINKPNLQQAPKQMAQIMQRSEQIDNLLSTFEENYLSELPPSLVQQEGWRKIERQALKNLRRKVGFFGELADVFYSEKIEQIKRLYFYSPEEIQDVLKDIAVHLEELEDTILHRIRGRIAAFKDIQELYLEQARPPMQAALQEMFEVAKGVSEHLTKQLKQVQKQQKEHLENNSETENDTSSNLLNEVIEENLSKKQKQKVRKGLSLEDFQNIYENKVRQTYWDKTKENQKEELSTLRNELRNQLEDARKTIQNIIQVTKEDIENTLSKARKQLASIYQQTAQEEREMIPFFREIRGKVERIFERKPFEEDFLTLYPDLTKANDIQIGLLKEILPKTIQNISLLNDKNDKKDNKRFGKTLIILDEALTTESQSLEKASWLSAFIFQNTHRNTKDGDKKIPISEQSVQIKILSEDALNTYYTKNQNDTAAFQHRLQDAMMNYATSEKGNLTVALKKLIQDKEAYSRIIVLSTWTEKQPPFPFKLLKEYRQKHRISPCIFIINLQPALLPQLRMRRNGVFAAQGIYENVVDWILEMECL